ncbi:iron ABC transporter permease [Paucilactobacillus suebicus]|uniref:Transport system permease protein n=1 Tax=Paucilactobacillus suebicus DSM 5007 = KCTC 3549 TaxID=1423807 RepID=A0A0R1WBU7_9LACO|nr:iron ABC transporter permease [Paucilactobacillus suebicus]KRM12969.1 transport system permease protein [Paucilactobacillus suebicus DSM 5007 = KCTC 3549]
MKTKKLTWINGVLLLILILAFVANLCGGVQWYGLNQLWADPNLMATKIMWTIRLPRSLSVVLVGALLAFSGQLMQALSKNPIADPSILGVNAGAMLALMIGSLFGISLSVFNTMWLSICGALITFLIVLGLSMTKQGIDPLRFILGGTVFASFISCIAYAVSLLTNSSVQFRNLLVGGFSGATYSQVELLTVGIIVVIVLVVVLRKSLTLLVLDDATASSLGAKPGVTRIIASLMVVICAGISVAVAGNIGFVGLGIPQVINYLHPDALERNVVPTMLAGGIFMLVVDLIAKTLAAPTELPLSALSAIFGGAFLFIIVAKGSRVTQI